MNPKIQQIRYKVLQALLLELRAEGVTNEMIEANDVSKVSLELTEYLLRFSDGAKPKTG
jgi:hypothetical protein